MKILVVDDSELMLRYVSDLLKKQGHEVVSGRGLGEAVDAFNAGRSTAPEAVLMDFILEGGMTGLEVLTAIFSLTPSGAKKPRSAILTQGELTRADQQKAASLGVEVLQKPIRGREDEFLARLNAWLAEGIQG